MARAPMICTALAAAAVMLTACSEQPQSAGTSHGSSAMAWNGPQTGFTAPGWKVGDQASWDEQIKQRNRGQNEYVRLAP